MKDYKITDTPMKIYGLSVIEEKDRNYWKLPLHMIERMPQYEYLGRRAMGGRVRFCTNSKNLKIMMTISKASVDVSVPLSCSAGCDIYLGKGEESKFLGYVAPKEYSDKEIIIERTFEKQKCMEIVTINFPRNEHLKEMVISIDDDAIIDKAPLYKYEKPIVFYGSSITEGGCASRTGNSYSSMVCRWLDSDYMNMGFSGKALGEEEFAEYICTIENIGMLVYDYDHNAPTTSHLNNTHEKFFKIIRERLPNLPIVILSKPDTDNDIEDSLNRKAIILNTYENAINNGDNNVWFVDGEQFFGTFARAECTVDGVHPNNLGFTRMALTLYPILEQILQSRY